MKAKNTATPTQFPVVVTVKGVSVKIHRRIKKVKDKEYVDYLVDYWLHGKRRQISRTDYSVAYELAAQACQAIVNGETQALAVTLTDRNLVVNIAQAVAGIEKPLEVIAHEYAEASKILAGRVTVIEAARFWAAKNVVTLTEIDVPKAKDLFLAEMEKEKSTLRYNALKTLLTPFAESCALQVQAVTPNIISQWLTKLEISDRSKFNYSEVLRYFNKWLILRGYLHKGTDWFEHVQKYSPRGDGEIEIFTPDEMRKLMATPNGMTPFFAIGAFAGLRHAEITRLDWRNVDLEDGFITVTAADAKTGERRLVPIQPNLKAWLLPLAKESGPVVPYKKTTQALLKIAAKSGVPWKHNALRHSFISYRVAQCADVPRVADEAGNSPQVIRTNYLRRVKPVQAEEWFNIKPQLLLTENTPENNC